MSTPDERVVAGLTCGEVLAALSDFLDNELETEKRQRLIAHVRGCDWCERFGGRFGKIIELLRRELHEAEPLRPEVAARLRERLAETRR
ncbi:MAG TPA: zf-HC2 domain-containing protein [Thermoanaerobaculia bacterium]|jgi:predicted anti-sigma-YlaC factor YlaD|nr:zf-HC2 domain-containing protein [Thermoanaerobaculia bacterium]